MIKFSLNYLDSICGEDRNRTYIIYKISNYKFDISISTILINYVYYYKIKTKNKSYLF